MGVNTKIEWCDSTVNPQEGCNGCELWAPGSGGSCYAGSLVSRWGRGSNAHPTRFDEPEIYPYRLLQACDWRDLTGTKRADKPWLDGMPRCIFVDDLGDTYTEKLDDREYVAKLVRNATAEGRPRPDMYRESLEAVRLGGHWLDPLIPMMADAPHLWMMLTKRPGRMAKAFKRLGYVPGNFILMTSVTSQRNRGRISDLLSIAGARTYGVSFEPVWGDVDFGPFLKPRDGRAALSWIIVGGESGPSAEPCDIWSLRNVEVQTREAGVPLFVKQLGKRCRMNVTASIPATQAGLRYEPETLTSGVVTFKSKGGNPETWPEDLRRREMPQQWRCAA